SPAASTCGRSSCTARPSACCRAASRAWPCGPAPTSSTRPRAAAARTPGCWPPGAPDALARRRRALLDGALPRALREHHPPAAGHRGLLLRDAGAGRAGRPLGLEGPARDLPVGPGRAAHLGLRAGVAGLPHGLLPGPRQSLLGALLAAARPRERALGAGGADGRGLPGPQRDLPVAGDVRPARPVRSALAPRRAQHDAQGPLHDRRRHRAHLHPRPGMALPAARYLAGAHLPRRAHPARQAAGAGRRRAARGRRAVLHAVAHAAAGARHARELPALVRRPAGAGAGRAVPAPRPALAALAAVRHGSGEGLPGAHRRRRRGDDGAAARRPPPRRSLLPGRAAGGGRRRRRLPRPRGRHRGPGPRRRGATVLRDLTMLLDIEHRLAFDYDAYISESFMELRVHPKTTSDQTVNSFVLSVGPPTRVQRYLDWNGNVTHHFTITRFHDRIEASSRSVVSTHPAAPPLAAITDPVGGGDLPYPLLDFVSFGGPVQLTPALRAAHKAAPPPRAATLGEHVLALSRHLASRFEYQKDVTKYDSTTEDFLKIGAGVCQDFTHLTLGL